MATMVQDEYRKDEILFQNIVMKYHPDFKYRGELEKAMSLKDASRGRYNVEFLVEETIGVCGNLERSAEAGMDYSDGSDCKTSSVHHRDVMRSNSMRWVISSTNSKHAWLRTVIYNPFLERLAFFMIPLHSRMRKYNVQSNGRGRIDGVYRLDSDHYQGIEKYRVNDFSDICRSVEEFEKKYITVESYHDTSEYDTSCIEDFLV